MRARPLACQSGAAGAAAASNPPRETRHDRFQEPVLSKTRSSASTEASKWRARPPAGSLQTQRHLSWHSRIEVAHAYTSAMTSTPPVPPVIESPCTRPAGTACSTRRPDGTRSDFVDGSPLTAAMRSSLATGTSCRLQRSLRLVQSEPRCAGYRPIGQRRDDDGSRRGHAPAKLEFLSNPGRFTAERPKDRRRLATSR